MDYFNVSYDISGNHGRSSGRASHIYIPDGTAGAITIDDEGGSTTILMPDEVQYLRITPVKEEEK